MNPEEIAQVGGRVGCYPGCVGCSFGCLVLLAVPVLAVLAVLGIVFI